MSWPPLRRSLAGVLSVALVAGVAGPVMAAEGPVSARSGPPASHVAPPTLALALATLAGGPGAATGVSSDDAAPAKVRLPACVIGDAPTRHDKVRQWKKTLLDTNLRLKRSYAPWDLVPVARAGIRGSGKVRQLVIGDLRALATAARRAGKPLAVRSAYRSYGYQRSLFDYYVRTRGYATAVTFSARPGHSEHQLGTTIDFTTAPSVPLTTSFGASPSGQWLAENGWRYGFIMSYPRGKKRTSCYGYEPWHWRYVGRPLARRMHESGQVPRRFLYETFETRP